MTLDEKLKPCPFCGGEARIERRGTSRVSTIYQCDDCGCSLETGEEWGHGRDWNRRAATAQQPDVDVVERVAKAIRLAHGAWRHQPGQDQHWDVIDEIYREAHRVDARAAIAAIGGKVDGCNYTDADVMDMRNILTGAIGALSANRTLSHDTMNAISRDLEKVARERGFWVDSPATPAQEPQP